MNDLEGSVRVTSYLSAVIEYFVFDEIIESDKIRLKNPDEGRAWKNMLFILGGASFVFGAIAVGISYGLDSSVYADSFGAPLALLSMLVFLYVCFSYLKYSCFYPLPLEIVFTNEGFVAYGPKGKVLRTVKIRREDRVTVKVDQQRVEIYRRDSLQSVGWYYLSKKSSTPAVHVSNLINLLGREKATVKKMGSRTYFYRSLGDVPSSIETGVPFQPIEKVKPIVRVDKHGNKFLFDKTSYYKFFTVRRSKYGLDISIRIEYFGGISLGIKVKPGEISYKEHFFLTVRIRPQEVIGLIWEPYVKDIGRYGIENLVPGVSVFIKAKTGFTYELMRVKLERELDRLKVEDLNEETQRLCDEVNTLFLSKAEQAED